MLKIQTAKEKIKIRKAESKDLKKVAEIFIIESAKKPYFQKWTMKKSLKKMIESLKKYDLHAAVIDKKVIGFITSYIEPDNNKKAYVDELWIKSNYQRKGVGKALVKFIENMYKNKGVRIIQVVSGRKSEAFKFYKKIKYKESKNLVFLDKKLR